MANSTAVVPYNPSLPYLAIMACQKAQHLPLESRLKYLANHLPEMLPFPFSGVIAFQIGNGPLIQACHSPAQSEFTVDQSFNVLSIGKLFTTISVMQLIEEKKFSLNTPLSDLLTPDELDLILDSPYLEEKPEPAAIEELKKHAGKITLEHLLSHKAGFVHREKSEGESWNINAIGKENYSNYGFQLLARIIGKHSDCGNKRDHEAGFRTHIEERIFKPARMEGAIREIHHPTKKTKCFQISEYKEVTEDKSPEPYPHGNGCWRMTAGDLLAFKQAMHQHNVLMREESFRTLTEYKEGKLGLWIDRDPETGAIEGYGHPGGGPGMSSFINTWAADPSITAVVLSNYSGCEMVKEFLTPFINHTLYTQTT